MSRYDVEAAVNRLRQLGVDTSTLHQDYYKIPLENIDLTKIEKAQPTNSKVISKHTIIVDSRQRDYSIYPYPSNYLVELMEPHRNVERIELIAAMMPKTEYNINSENNLLIVNIGGTVVNGVFVGGTTRQITLTPGQYLIGSNVTGSINYVADGTVPKFGLISELYKLLNLAFYGFGVYNFNVFLATIPGNAGGTGQNAAVLNRIVITNDQDTFSIDFRNNLYVPGSPFRVMGFNKQIYTSATNSVVIYGSADDGSCAASDLESGATHTITINAMSGIYDYNIKDDPKYLIMQLEFGNKSADRVESSDIATNQKFAIVIYDSNDPDNIQTYNSGTTDVKLTITRPPGNLKALKGSDFDKKILHFEPPLTLENFKISFYKYDNTYYDFHNREHLLTFELDVADYDPKYRY
jgi:VCBS repeat-containing protein